jgi:murein DD-endopeptidase MepM/ murein hydrolase activator NlpD
VLVLEELRETYANHSETKEWYENQAAAEAEKTEEIRQQEEDAEEELQEYIRQQQAEIAVKMAAKKKKLAEERKNEETVVTAQNHTKTTEKTDEETSAVTTAPSETESYAVTTVPTENKTTVTTVVTEDEYDIYVPEDDSDEFYAETTVVTESNFYDPADDYEWGKSYNTTAETTAAEEESSSSAEYDGDKGYGTYSYTGFIWPVPSVRNTTDTYGSRYIEEEGTTSFHKGIDINKPNCSGEPIVASAGGVVITASDTNNGYGTHVVIDHGDGISTLYGHMSSTTVSVGDEVQQGQIIGYIGNTGQAYGYHCHFEVRIDGQHTDPFEYVDINN